MSSDHEQQLDAAAQRVTALTKSILNLVDGVDAQETLYALKYVVGLQLLNINDERDALQRNIKIFGEHLCEFIEGELKKMQKKMQEMKSQLNN